MFGQIHGSLPWDQLAALIPIENSGPGAPKWFDAKGMFALMFLKAYLNVSDRQLIERLNSDYSLQMFCGKVLAEDRQIRDTTIMARVRKYIEDRVIGEKETYESRLLALIDKFKRMAFAQKRERFEGNKDQLALNFRGR